MVQKKSEYQNQFKSSVVKNNQPSYLENLTFRQNRRNREFLHTPICWSEVEDEEVASSENEDSIPEKARSKKVVSNSNEPQYQSLAEILAESRKKNDEFRQNKANYVQDVDINKVSLIFEESKDIKSADERILPKCINDDIEANKNYINEKDFDKFSGFDKQKVVEEVQKESDDKDESKLINNKNNARNGISSFGSKKQRASKNVPCDTQAQNIVPKLLKSTGKPRRPDRQGTIPGTKQSKMTVCSSLEKPPFVSYGVGDREPSLVTHRTHNVRSSCDVYAQALKAQRLREASKRRRLREKKRAIASASALMDKLELNTPRDSQSWQSEYRKQFHGYEPREYERAMSSRAVISHSRPISAVHRGGCMIVHVD